MMPGGVTVKVVAFLTASVDGGSWSSVPLEADTDMPIMRLVIGNPEKPLIDCSTPDPELRAHVESVFSAIADHVRHLTISPN